MKVKILRNLGLGLPPFQEGDEQDLDDVTAQKLISLKVAEPIIKAVTGKKGSINGAQAADEAPSQSATSSATPAGQPATGTKATADPAKK